MFVTFGCGILIIILNDTGSYAYGGEKIRAHTYSSMKVQTELNLFLSQFTACRCPAGYHILQRFAQLVLKSQ